MSMTDKFKDRENLRYVFLSDGNYFKLVRTDPYGFWHVEIGEGRQPDCFKNASYTEVDKARTAVSNYVQNDYGKYAEIVAQPVIKAEPVKMKREKPVFEGTEASV